MAVPARNAIVVRQTEAAVTARTVARLLDVGLINRTPESLAHAAKYVGVEVAAIRDAATVLGERGYSPPRDVLVDGASPASQEAATT